MNETRYWIFVDRSIASRFVKSDDNVGSKRDARAPGKNAAYADLL